jgi:DNA-binding response OmpR family regulator
MLIALLRSALIEAKAVGTGAQALSSIQTERFDLDLTGLTMISRALICAARCCLRAGQPILFFSGAAYEADKKRGIEAGADAYVIKPDLDGLVGSITQLVSHCVCLTRKVGVHCHVFDMCASTHTGPVGVVDPTKLKTSKSLRRRNGVIPKSRPLV